MRGSRYQQSTLEQGQVLENENILSWQLEHVKGCGLVLQVWNWKQTIVYRRNRFFSETCSYIMNVIHSEKHILLKFV